jgi:Flp pilus assembly protein TadG
MKTCTFTLRKNEGAVLLMTVLSLIVILGMAGLAIDSANKFSNLTRLQTATDAAALAAAQELLDEVRAGAKGNITLTKANTAGTVAFRANLNEFGSFWLPSSSRSGASTLSTADVDFCWSTSVNNFSGCVSDKINFSAAAAANGFFVRARVPNTPVNNILIQVMGLGSTSPMAAVAVAGTICPGYDCGLAPFFVCDNSANDPNNSNPGSTDTDCADGRCFGQPVTLETDTEVKSDHFFVLKTGPDSPPQTPVPPLTEIDCSYTNNTSFVKDGCLMVWDQRDTDSSATTTVDETLGFAVPINRSPPTPPVLDFWAFNPNIQLGDNGGGNFGYLDLLSALGDRGNSGANQMKDDLLSGNACLNGLGTGTNAQSQTGNVDSLDQAFNALFGLPGGSYASPGAGNPFNPITNWSDYVAAITGGGVAPSSPYPYQPISFNYYNRLYKASAWANNTKYHQRLRPVPVIECPNPMSGNQTNLVVKGYACFFFNRKMYASNETGNLEGNSPESWVIAEHIDNKFCPTEGTDTNACDLKDLSKANIVLYQAVDSPNS